MATLNDLPALYAAKRAARANVPGLIEVDSRKEWPVHHLPCPECRGEDYATCPGDFCPGGTGTYENPHCQCDRCHAIRVAAGLRKLNCDDSSCGICEPIRAMAERMTNEALEDK